MKENMEMKRRWYHMVSKTPDRLSCGKADKEIYDTLKKEAVFKGLDLIHIFMMALSIGYKEKRRVPLNTKEGLILLYHIPEQYKNIMKAIAIKEMEGDLKVMLSAGEIYSIAEEYATGGIRILKQKILGGEFGSYSRRLEAELLEIYKAIE